MNDLTPSPARFSENVALLGGLMLLASAVFVSAEVLARKFLAVSLDGANEMSGYAMAISSAWAFSYALYERAHIRIDAVISAAARPRAGADRCRFGRVRSPRSGRCCSGSRFVSSLSPGPTTSTPTPRCRRRYGCRSRLWYCGLILFFLTSLLVTRQGRDRLCARRPRAGSPDRRHGEQRSGAGSAGARRRRPAGPAPRRRFERMLAHYLLGHADPAVSRRAGRDGAARARASASTPFTRRCPSTVRSAPGPGRRASDILLVTVPMFILLGEIMLRSASTERMYGAMVQWLSWLPGGLMHANIGASHGDCRDRRLERRDRSDGLDRGRAADRPLPLQRAAVPRLARRRRHARHPDPALDQPDHLRLPHRHLGPEALSRRLHSRASCSAFSSW